jgi:hypothetical protein
MTGWRVTPGQTLRHRSWAGDSVLFNDISGATHLLTEDTLQLLLALQAQTLDAAELADPEVQEELLRLQKLYLIEPC